MGRTLQLVNKIKKTEHIQPFLDIFSTLLLRFVLLYPCEAYLLKSIFIAALVKIESI